MMLEKCHENDNNFLPHKWKYDSPEPQNIIICSKSFPPISDKHFSLPKDNYTMDRRKKKLPYETLNSTLSPDINFKLPY